MEPFSALLALCAGKSPVSGEFPAQRSVTRSFDVFFDLPVSKRLSKQSLGWWFETLWRSLWRHRNDCCLNILCIAVIWQIKTHSKSGQWAKYITLLVQITLHNQFFVCRVQDKWMKTPRIIYMLPEYLRVVDKSNMKTIHCGIMYAKY